MEEGAKGGETPRAWWWAGREGREKDGCGRVRAIRGPREVLRAFKPANSPYELTSEHVNVTVLKASGVLRGVERGYNSEYSMEGARDGRQERYHVTCRTVPTHRRLILWSINTLAEERGRGY